MAYIDEVLADNPLVYYRFEETSGNPYADSSGNNRGGTWAATAIQKGQASLLNNQPAGASAILPASTVNTVGLATVGDLTTGLTGLTFEAWVRFGGTLPTSTSHDILRMNGNQGLAIGTSGGLPYFGFKLNLNTTSSSTTLRSDQQIEVNRAYHFVAVLEDLGASLSARIYIDGELVYTQSPVLGVSSPNISAWASSTINIGQSTRTYSLQIDEAAIYPTALSAARISAHYNAGIAPAWFAPTNTAAPSISGTARVGQTLSTTNGTWSADPAPSYTYAWEQSDNGSTGWSTISGATSSTYTLATAQAGKYVRAKVTATNSEGSATATSTASAQITEIPVVSTPTVSGTAAVGQTLTASASATAGFPSPSLSYQWQRSTNSGSTWSNITGSTSATYIATSTDAGAVLRVQVTATNSEGSDTEASIATSAITEPPSISAPSITGEARVGEVLTASEIEASGFPVPDTGYQWQVSDTGSTWNNLTLETGSTFTPTSSEAGKLLRVQVTATNTVGSDSETSEATDPVLWDPANSSIPSISYPANLEVGETLTAAPGTWTGYPEPAEFDFQWEISDDGSTGWEDIDGETTDELLLTSAMTTRYARVKVSTTTEAGTADAYSVTTGYISEDPASIVAPTVAGINEVNETLAVDPGEWTGFPEPNFSFAWEISETGSTGWEEIEDADGNQLVIGEFDDGLFIRAQVTGTNEVGSATAASNVIGPILKAPFVIDPPIISGLAIVGETLEADPGLWGGYEEPTLSYQWRKGQLNESEIYEFENISGATSTTLELTEGLAGYKIVFRVTATNSVDSEFMVSAPVGEVAKSPAFTDLPEIVGMAQVGETLLGSEGVVSGYPEPVIDYQWQREIDGEWIDIAGAIFPSYEVEGEDLGISLRLLVTASNIAGEVSVPSPPTDPVIPAFSAPIVITEPTVSGSFRVDQIVTATPGTYEGYPEPEVTGQWVVYMSLQAETPTGQIIEGQEIYIEQHLVGLAIRWEETVTNSEGEVTGLSEVKLIEPPISPGSMVLPVSNARLYSIKAGTLTGIAYDSEFQPEGYQDLTRWSGNADAYFRQKIKTVNNSGRADRYRETTVLIPNLVPVRPGYILSITGNGVSGDWTVDDVEQVAQDPGLPPIYRCYITESIKDDPSS
jgi:hypothetical protein